MDPPEVVDFNGICVLKGRRGYINNKKTTKLKKDKRNKMEDEEDRKLAYYKQIKMDRETLFSKLIAAGFSGGGTKESLSISCPGGCGGVFGESYHFNGTTKKCFLSLSCPVCSVAHHSEEILDSLFPVKKDGTDRKVPKIWFQVCINNNVSVAVFELTRLLKACSLGKFSKNQKKRKREDVITLSDEDDEIGSDGGPRKYTKVFIDLEALKEYAAANWGDFLSFEGDGSDASDSDYCDDDDVVESGGTPNTPVTVKSDPDDDDDEDDASSPPCSQMPYSTLDEESGSVDSDTGIVRSNAPPPRRVTRGGKRR